MIRIKSIPSILSHISLYRAGSGTSHGTQEKGKDKKHPLIRKATPKVPELSTCWLREDTGKPCWDRESSGQGWGRVQSWGKAPGKGHKGGDTATAPTGEGERLRFPRNPRCQGRSGAIPSGKPGPGHGPGAQRHPECPRQTRGTRGRLRETQNSWAWKGPLEMIQPNPLPSRATWSR